jgi:tetratricopeptide (TPR) repeat protein
VLQNSLKDLILVLLDVAEPEGKELAETFKVRAFPTFAVLDARGERVFSWIGYGRPQGWVERLAEALRDSVTVARRQARYRSEPNFHDALVLGKIASREGSYREAHSYYRQAQMLDPQAAQTEEVDMLIFRAVFSGVAAGQFEVEQAGREVEKILGGGQIKPEHALEAAERLISMRNRIGDAVIVPYLEMAHPVVERIKDPQLDRRRGWVLTEYALIVEQDTVRALELKKAAFPDGWRSDPDLLNEFAWWCFQNRFNIEEAADLSRRSIELSQPGPEQANYLDTLAELVNLQGDPERALELIEQALQMNPESRYLKNQQARFQDLLGEHHQQEPST